MTFAISIPVLFCVINQFVLSFHLIKFNECSERIHFTQVHRSIRVQRALTRVHRSIRVQRALIQAQRMQRRIHHIRSSSTNAATHSFH